MIKIGVLLLLLVHGLIHVMGFAKAFGLVELQQLTQTVLRPWGVVWGGCALLFIGAAALRLVNAQWWWMLAAPALVISQVVIVAFWNDAKIGTIANVLLLVPVLIGFGRWQFSRQVDANLAQLAEHVPRRTRQIVRAEDIDDLPPVVAAWLTRAGVIGRPRVRAIHVSQHGKMQQSPGSKWMSFRAEQWFAVPEPAFLWVVEVDARFGLSMAGRDYYVDGKGSMRIELVSLIPVVDASGPKLDQGTLVRFLAETMWFPSAALEPYIRWEPLDARSARATMRYCDVEATGVFRFDDAGDVIGFEAPRYRDAVLEDWILDNDTAAFKQLDGVRIPTRSTITWRNKAGESWTWLRLEVDEVGREAEIVR